MSAASPPIAVQVTGLSKSYGDRTVLDGIDLTIPEGTILALLGPNGAGKTTIVQILATLIPADGGQATLAGYDLASQPQKVRASIGVTGQFSAVDGLLTGAENLLMMGDLHHLPRRESRARAARLLKRFDLADVADRYATTYSGGMKRRLDLAMSLVGEPRVVFLDEPTTGLDPHSRRTMWQIVRELLADGVAVLLTTQYLQEADELADRVSILDRGRIVAHGTPQELKRLVPGERISLRFADAAGLDAAVRALADARPDHASLTLELPGDGSVGSLKALLARLDDHSIVVERLSIRTPDLDDVFFALTGTPAAP